MGVRNGTGSTARREPEALEIRRPELEDIYLDLIRETEAADAAAYEEASA